MDVREFQITEREKVRILALKEGHFFDAKAKNIEPRKLSVTVSALANADGGEIYVGLEESVTAWKWNGFQNAEAANSHLQVLDSMFPLGHDFSCSFLGMESALGLLLHIQIRKTRSIVRATNKTPYVRLGAQNLPVDTDEKHRRLERNKGIISFESETVNTTFQTITESDVIKTFIQEVVPLSDSEQWLKKQQLIVRELPTVSGVLLFADLPQAFLPKRSGIKISRFLTSAAVGTRDTLDGIPETIEGCVYDLIKSAVSRTQEIIHSARVISKDGLEVIDYPTETLHEVITNAVIHRDYEVANDVDVRIFDNRVEVESPGLLPGHITVDNILSESFRRNGNLVRILNKFPDPPNKDIGEGLRTAFEAMRKLRLKDPLIYQASHSVVVELRHERLASAEDLVMQFVSDKATITNRQAREICGIPTENSMKSVFIRLKERGLLEQVPGLETGPRAAWRKVERDDGGDNEGRKVSKLKQKSMFDHDDAEATPADEIGLQQ